MCIRDSYEKAAQLSLHPLIKGIFFVRARNYDAAIEVLNSPIGELEDHRLFYLAQALYNKERWQEAKEELSKALRIPPYLEEEYYEILVQSLVKLKETERATEIINRIKNRAHQLYLKAKLFDREGRKAAAQKLYWDLIGRFPGSAQAYSALDQVQPKHSKEFIALAELFYYHANYRKALSYLNRAKGNSSTYFLRGMIFYNLGRYDSSLYYFSLNNSLKSYYWRGRIYETQNQDSLALMSYDSLLIKFPNAQFRLRALRRKGHLLEERASFIEACSTFVTIALQFPEEKKRNLFRSGLLCYRMGQIDKAKEFFSQDSSAEFIYWHMRMNERLGLSTESLKVELLKRHPLSYYTMIKEKQNQFYDTIPLNSWLSKFADTLPQFTSSDSIALKRTNFFLLHGELLLATCELKLIEANHPAEILYLAQLCSQYGIDHEAIRLGYAVKRAAERSGIRKLSKELLPMLYPIKYALSIKQAEIDPALTLAVIRQESYFNPKARSPANALGIMQIIPHTGRLLAKDLDLERYDLFDPQISIQFGTKYLKDQLNAFDCLALALAAYNGGPINVIKWLNKDPASELDEFIELIPFDETRDYVKNILLQKEIYTQLLNPSDLP